MKLSEPQQTISDDPKRFRVVSAGRRWGKSFLSINEIAKYARHPDQHVLYVAPTYRQAKNVIWEELKSRLYAKQWISKANESELEITLVNNSRIRIRSADNYDALRGSKYNFLVMDEVADIKEDCWYQVLRPTLSDTQGDALFIGTPKGRGSWFYDLYQQYKENSDWSSYQFTTVDGGNVTESEIESAKRDLDDRTFQQEYLAKFVDYSGMIFYAFDFDRHVKKLPDISTIDPRVPLRIGLDFNVSPISAVISVRHHDELRIFDEIVIYGSNTSEMVSEIQTRYPNRKIIVYPDATGKRTNTNSQGMSDHIILSNAGFKLVTDRANPNVNDSIIAVNSAFKTDRVWIDPSCRHLIESLSRYAYKEGTRQPDKNGQWDHMSDAIRYLIWQEIKLEHKFTHTQAKSFRTL